MHVKREVMLVPRKPRESIQKVAKRNGVARRPVSQRSRDSLKKGVREFVVPFIQQVEAQRGVQRGEKIKFR